MRYFELKEGHGVNPRNVILKMCVSLLSGKHFDSKHWGSELQNADMWDMWKSFKDELPPEIAALSADEGVATVEFRRLVVKWAAARFKNVEAKLATMQPYNGGFILHRVIRVPLSKFEHAKQTGATDLGIFWSCEAEGDWEPRAVWGEGKPGVDVIIEASIPDTSVDWPNTYLANMDWFAGDYEGEIRLRKGSPVNVRGIFDLDTGKALDIDISGVKFTA